MIDDQDFTLRQDPARAAARHHRERSRITIQFTPEEKQAIDWLSRCPHTIELPPPFRALRRCAARQIAKVLNAQQIIRLVTLRAEKIAAAAASSAN
jgi:hypothetical protein